MDDQYLDSYYESLTEITEYNEYNDQDATDCANGDYNTFEENQSFLDNEE